MTRRKNTIFWLDLMLTIILRWQFGQFYDLFPWQFGQSLNQSFTLSVHPLSLQQLFTNHSKYFAIQTFNTNKNILNTEKTVFLYSLLLGSIIGSGVLGVPMSVHCLSDAWQKFNLYLSNPDLKGVQNII